MKRLFGYVQTALWPVVVIATCLHGWSQLDELSVAAPFRVLFWLEVGLLLASAARWLR